MRYYKQGQHDGLCGFVAALNVLDFLQRRTGHAFARDDDAAFFDEAVECVARVPGCDLRILKSDPRWGVSTPSRFVIYAESLLSGLRCRST